MTITATITSNSNINDCKSTSKLSLIQSSAFSVSSLWLICTSCNISSLYRCIPWMTIKHNLYECWLCFYSPIFWFAYLFTSSWKLRDCQKTSQATIDAMVFSYKEDDYISITSTLSASANPSSTIHHSSAAPALSALGNSSSSSSEDDDSPSIRSNKSFKRALKGHFQSFRQKQQSLNEVMKRSLLRKTSKLSLQIEAPPSSSTIGTMMKSSISSSTKASTSSSSSSSSSASVSSEPSPASIASSPTLVSSPTDLSLSPPSMQQFVHVDSACNTKLKSFHPLALDRRVSLSDSLLKSLNRKRKQPSLPPPTLITASSSNDTKCNNMINSNYNNNNNKETRFFSPYFDSLSSSSFTHPLAAAYHRRKTFPEIVVNSLTK